MNESMLMTYGQTSEHFDISRGTVADLVIKLGLTPKPMTNGKAKGLDKSDIRKIAKCLGMSRHSATASH